MRQVLAWMGRPAATNISARTARRSPPCSAAQPVYGKYWRSRGVDVSPFFTVLDGPRIPPPGGAGFAAGFEALKPYFDEMFLGSSWRHRQSGRGAARRETAAQR